LLDSPEEFVAYMEQFEEIRTKALELFQHDKYSIVDHALERMIEKNIQYEDIESVPIHCLIYRNGFKGARKLSASSVEMNCPFCNNTFTPLG